MERLKKPIFMALFLVTFSYCSIAASVSLEQQRAIYQKAQKFLNKKQVNNYLEIRNLIADYPLTPYLDYRSFLVDIGKRTPEEVEQFTKQYSDFPFSSNVRAAYLDELIAKKDWGTFYQYQTYEPNMKRYQCHYYYAHLKNAHLKNGNKQKAFEGAEKLWLSNESVSGHCDSLFQEWQYAGLRTDDIVLKKMWLSYERNDKKQLDHLMKMLVGETNIQQAKEIKRLTEEVDYVVQFAQKHPATELNRKRTQIALKKLANKDIELAYQALPAIFDAQAFSKSDKQNMADFLAVLLINTEKEHLAQWRDEVLKSTLNVSALERRIRLAIRQADWQGVYDWIAYLPESERDSLRWQYWLARSEISLGLDYRIIGSKNVKKQGSKRLEALLGQRHFYSLAAAKILGEPIVYQVNKEIPDTNVLKPYISSLIRIDELIDTKKIAAAKSEWNWLLGLVGEKEKKALAAYAANEEWHHLSVRATIKAEMWDNTALRFPLAYQQWFKLYGSKHRIDPITLMSLARQESALDITAYSPAGALGIMQIMPKTAKYMAEKHKLKYQNVDDLYDVRKNIEIGSEYLSSLLKRYNNNRIFAFAAYNAGPSRVKAWRENTNEQLDVFAFIEAIPFRETRSYVQNILMFETYYRELMQVDGKFLYVNELLAKY